MARVPKTVVQMKFSGSIGGAESVAFLLAKVLSCRIEHSILYVIVEDRAGAEARDAIIERVDSLGVPVRIFHTASRWSPGLYGELKRALQEDRADIVHAHCYKAACYAFAVKHFAGGLKGVVFTLHGLFEPLRPRSVFMHAAYATAVVCADTIVGCSAEISAKYQRCPVVRRKIEVIQNCLFTDERHDLARIALAKQEARHRMASLWGLDESALWVANVGRLAEQKNFPLYLRAAESILQSKAGGTKVRFLVVGDGPLRPGLELLVAKLGIRKYVTFTSFVSDMDMLWTGIDLLMVTSIWEGTPMCVLEAMAFGTPVVATTVGGIPDVVRHGETGLLVRGFDPDTLANAAMQLLADGKRREAMGSAAHKLLIEHFSQGKWAERHYGVYLELMIA